VPAVAEQVGDAWLEVLAPTPGAVYRLGDWPVTIGYTDDCEIKLADGTGRPERARIWRREGRYMLHKISRLGSVTVSDRPTTWVILEDGDEVQIGGYRLLFRDRSKGGS
jgi:predicted component of type VI protein secretion system